MDAKDEAGFTLIEALIALAILAMSAVALLSATEAHVARIGGLEARALAQIAADNHLAEIELGAAGDTAEPTLLGRTFRVTADREPTEDPDLERIDLTVTDAGGETLLRGYVGFVHTGGDGAGADP